MRPVPRRLAGDKLGAQRSPWAWRHHNVSTVQSCTRQEAHISVWWMAFYYYYYELKHHDSSARLPGVPLGRASKHRFWCTVYGLLWKRNDFQSLHDMLLLKSSKSKKIVAWWLFFLIMWTLLTSKKLPMYVWCCPWLSFWEKFLEMFGHVKISKQSGCIHRSGDENRHHCTRYLRDVTRKWSLARQAVRNVTVQINGFLIIASLSLFLRVSWGCRSASTVWLNEARDTQYNFFEFPCMSNIHKYTYLYILILLTHWETTLKHKGERSQWWPMCGLFTAVNLKVIYDSICEPERVLFSQYFYGKWGEEDLFICLLHFSADGENWGIHSSRSSNTRCNISD